MSFVLECPSHYNLLDSVHAWVYPDLQPVPEITGSSIFGRIYDVSGIRICVLLQQEVPGEPILVSYLPNNVKLRANLRTLLKGVLGLEVNTKSALEEIENDSAVRHIIPGVRGLRPYQSPTAFEALVKTVIQQQISYRAANVITRRLVENLSSSSGYDGIELHSFPTSLAILEAGEEKMRELGLGFKIPYLTTISKMHQAGHLDTATLRSMPYEDLVRLLKPIRGIGEWTIQMLSIAGLGNFNVFPYGDLGIRSVLGRLYCSGTPMTASQVRAKSEEWRDGTLVLYLLMCADVLGLFPEKGRLKTVKRSASDQSSRNDR